MLLLCEIEKNCYNFIFHCKPIDTIVNFECPYNNVVLSLCSQIIMLLMYLLYWTAIKTLLIILFIDYIYVCNK